MKKLINKAVELYNNIRPYRHYYAGGLPEICNLTRVLRCVREVALSEDTGLSELNYINGPSIGDKHIFEGITSEGNKFKMQTYRWNGLCISLQYNRMDESIDLLRKITDEYSIS